MLQEDILRKYLSIRNALKMKDQRILQFIKEPFGSYPINKDLTSTINKWKEAALKNLSGGSVNRKLDVISSMYTTFKREWGYKLKILCCK